MCVRSVSLCDKDTNVPKSSVTDVMEEVTRFDTDKHTDRQTSITQPYQISSFKSNSLLVSVKISNINERITLKWTYRTFPDL